MSIDAGQVWISVVPSPTNYKQRVEWEPVYQRNVIIKLPDGNVLELPLNLAEVADAIDKSSYILELHDDWDGEGSPAYNPKTWIRAITFLSSYATYIYEKLNQVIDPPEIYHGPDSSIDIYWAYDDKTLLINIPNDKRERATFYGKYSNGAEVSGKINTDQLYQGILMWLNKV